MQRLFPPRAVMALAAAIAAIVLVIAPVHAGDLELPADPAFTVRRVTAQDVREAREAGVDVLAHLFGERAATVARFNRMDPKFARPGRRIKVPDLPDGAIYTPLPSRYPPGADKEKLILIVRDLQFVGAYERGELVASYPASTGKRGHRTPAGRTRVTAKDADHASSIYPEPDGGWPMPWAVRFRGTAYWIHGGDLPGWPASHGCVRLYPDDARALFEWAEIGTTVHVVTTLAS